MDNGHVVAIRWGILRRAQPRIRSRKFDMRSGRPRRGVGISLENRVIGWDTCMRGYIYILDEEISKYNLDQTYVPIQQHRQRSSTWVLDYQGKIRQCSETRRDGVIPFLAVVHEAKSLV